MAFLRQRYCGTKTNSRHDLPCNPSIADSRPQAPEPSPTYNRNENFSTILS
jgi:hypothetical protein